MVSSEMLILIYFVTLMFLGNHSITVQRGEKDSFEKTLNNCANYTGIWNSSTSCKCFMEERTVLMSNDEQMYGCKGMENTGMSCKFNLKKKIRKYFVCSLKF